MTLVMFKKLAWCCWENWGCRFGRFACWWSICRAIIGTCCCGGWQIFTNAFTTLNTVPNVASAAPRHQQRHSIVTNKEINTTVLVRKMGERSVRCRAGTYITLCYIKVDLIKIISATIWCRYLAQH